MKIGVLTNAFCEEELIVGCIQQFGDLFEHVVLVSKTPWHGEYKSDNTHVIAANLGATVQVGNWSSASEQLNHGLSLFKEYDWVIIVDADERYSKSDLQMLVNDLGALKRMKFKGSVRTNSWDVYWKTPNWKIVPEQTDYPLIAITPDQSFGHIRSHTGQTAWSSANMHHFSYVRNDESMLKKITSFDASVEFDPYKWYVEKWLRWNPDMEDLHPVNPPQFKKAILDPPPNDILLLIP